MEPRSSQKREKQAEKKQRIIHALAQNNPCCTGVRMNVEQREEAISFFKILATNSVCTSVKVTGPGIDDKSVAFLASCLSGQSSLAYVEIGNCRLSAEGLKDIAKGFRQNQKLKTFSLGPITKTAPRLESGIENLLAAVAESQTLRVDLKNIALNDSVAFVRGITKHLPRSCLRAFVLDSFSFTDEALQMLGPSIASCGTLTLLMLKRIRCTPLTALRHLLKPLSALSNINRISFNRTQLKETEHMLILGNEVIAQCDSLREVELSGCKITTEGANFVFAAITKNRPLVRVDLSDNEITTIRALSLGKLTTVLTDLNLAGNKLSEETLSHLAQELPLNRTLTKLNLCRNSFLPESARQFLNPIILGPSKLRDLITDESAVKSAQSSSATATPTPRSSSAENSMTSPRHPVSSLSQSTNDEEDSVSDAPSKNSEKVISPRESEEIDDEWETPLIQLRKPPLPSAPPFDHQKGKLNVSKTSPSDVKALRRALRAEILIEVQPVIKDMVQEALKKRIALLPAVRDMRALVLMEQQITEAIRKALEAKLSTM